ncbi:MAG: peptidylprolyl isomerase, partial [Verrucomicrobiota bacterium]
GEITLELDGEKAPITVDNFLKYAESGYYKGTVFHRVIRNSMIQGGSYLPNLGQKEGLFTPIKSESTNGLKNVKGSIAMARLPGTDTSTSQFFINVNNNGVWDYLDEKRPGYAVFGKVIGGLLTVDAIRNGRTSNRGGFEDVPDDPVVIEDVTRIE